MVHKYYCVDCGERFDGSRISFDLGELIGLRYRLTDGRTDKLDGYNTSLGQVTFEQILNYGKEKTDDVSDEDGEKRYGKIYAIRYSLKSYLQVMAYNYAGGEKDPIKARNYRGQAENLKLNHLYDEPKDNILCDILGLNKEGLNTAMEIRFFVNSLLSIFHNTGARDEQDTDKYVCQFEVRPVLFSDSPAIETLEYRNSINTIWTKISYGGKIRGYCPKCGSPVIDGCGRCEHILVGLLGAQSAGKTSTIIALMAYMKSKFDEFGLKRPSSIPSRDRKYKKALENLKLYENGWAVKKTNINDATTFNASLLLKSNKYKHVEKLITFIDIAGEVLYDKDEGGLDTEQLKVYPLMDKCDLYIVCNCTNNKENVIPQDAIIDIATQIYDNRGTKPPMCITLTKIDQIGEPSEVNGVNTLENVFEDIYPAGNYAYALHLNTLKQGYGQDLEQSVKDALLWCYNTYNTFRNETFVTMINTAAYGYTSRGRKDDGEMPSTQTSQDGKPRPKGIDDLWRWVITMSGLIETPQGYILRAIPEKEKTVSARPQYYQALQSQFINPPHMPMPEKQSQEKDKGQDSGLMGKILSFFK